MSDILEFNKEKMVHVAGPLDAQPKLMQRADLVWSRMKLEEGEVLLVKVGKHMTPALEEIRYQLELCFKEYGDRVLLFVDGDVDFTKVQKS